MCVASCCHIMPSRRAVARRLACFTIDLGSRTVCILKIPNERRVVPSPVALCNRPLRRAHCYGVLKMPNVRRVLPSCRAVACRVVPASIVSCRCASCRLGIASCRHPSRRAVASCRLARRVACFSIVFQLIWNSGRVCRRPSPSPVASCRLGVASCRRVVPSRRTVARRVVPPPVASCPLSRN